MKKDIDCNDKIHGKINNGKSSTPATAKSDPKKNKKEVDDIKSSTNHDDDEMKVSAIDTPGATYSDEHAHLVQYTREKNKERLRRRVARRSSIHVPLSILSPEAAEAARIGDSNMLSEWLQHGDINAVDTSKFGHKRTALHKAAAYGKSHVVQMLLERGADPDCLDKFHRTPLFWAARHGHAITLQNLLDFGCEFELKDKFGKTALELAKEEHEDECVAIIERFTRSHARLVCMRVLGGLTNDPRLRAIWQWRIWIAEQSDNEAANRALDAAAKTHMLKQQYEREQTKAIEKVKRLHEMEMLELRQKLEDALMLVRQLSHSPRNSIIKQLNSDEKNTHVIKKNLDKSNDVSNLSDNTEEINISLKDVVVDVQV